MFYPVAAIDELMPDVLVLNETPSQQVDFPNSFGDFSKTMAAGKASSNVSIISGNRKDLATKPVWQTLGNNSRSLPESVLCHPSIGYSFRYGNVMLNGLDNSIEK